MTAVEPETIAQCLRRATERLSARGVESARLDAELLLASALGVERTRLWTESGSRLAADASARFEPLLRRREAREPLQRIRGTQEFYSRTFDVRGPVLIPRGDTETLIDAALECLTGRVRPRIVDLGTGSGAIAATLALEIPDAEVVAIDASEAAAAVARANAARLGARIDVRVGDWTEPCRGERFDLVASNPPYVPSAHLTALDPEVRDFEPRLALDGGCDGLDAYRRLAEEIGAILAPGGHVIVEIGFAQQDAVRALFSARGLRQVAARRDLAGVERVLVLVAEADPRG